MLRLHYEEAAQAYLRSLTLEQTMEATPQARQRQITLASLALVHARRPDFQVFNELLVQYPVGRGEKIGQVVPDNMVVVHDEELEPMTSFNLPLAEARPFWVLEYVSRGSKRKDYQENFRKYERELKVLYYLIFHPDDQELTLHRLNQRRRRYDPVPPDDRGRHAVAEVNVEVALLDGWARFWFEGRLLPLPGELDRDLRSTREELERQRQRADAERQRADAERQRAEQLEARLRALGIDPEA